MRIYRAGVLAALVVGLAGFFPLRACGFCKILRPPIPTFHRDAATSKLILYGHLENARKAPGAGGTDLVIRSVLKDHPILGDRRRVLLPYYIDSADAKKPPLMVVFAEVYKGKLDFYRGVYATPALVDYIKGLLTIPAEDRVKLLRYCFDYLDHSDREISEDAYQEFVRSSYPELHHAAKAFPGARLRRWLHDPSIRPERRNLYGLLLGQCGGELDADFLRTLLEKARRKSGSPPSDGLLTGYALLKPREGWAYVRDLLKPSGDFHVRFAGFRVIKFLDTTRPGLVPRKDLLAGLRVLLDQADFADLPIEYLRQQRYWDLTGQILPLFTRESHKAAFIRRAIVRYALQCPGAQAREFVAALRRDDPELVAETEELLKLETKSVPRKR
jgi:hypothetical protein